MLKLSEVIGRRRRWVIAAWLVIVAVALPFAAQQTDHLTGGGFDVPGSQSKAVTDGIQRDFRGQVDGIAALFDAEGASAAERAAGIERLRDAVAETDDLSLGEGAAARAERELAARGEALVPISSKLSADELIDPAVDLRETLDPGVAENGVTPYLVGQATVWAGFQELSKEDLESAEGVGFPIVALILLAVFGSLAAAALPLALGFVSVLVTGALIYAISLQMDTSIFVTNMASMIGIGVAVDYSLFILARYREERRAGRSDRDARSEALATSGMAVVFSGLAVIVSLAGLWMVPNQALRSMALGAMTVVAVSILTATTLLPALIAALGNRVEAGGVTWRLFAAVRRPWRHRRRPGSTRPAREGFWDRWTARVMARPWTAVIGVSAVMLTLSIPVLSMETGNAPLEQFPKGHDVRVSHERAAQLSGGGADPVQIYASFEEGGPRDGGNAAAVSGLVADLRSDPGVDAVPAPLESAGSVLIQATPAGNSEGPGAEALVKRLRESVVPASGLSAVATLDVGGETARTDDVRGQISGSMWKILLFVLGFSFLVLMVMLRSVLLPLKAVLMNLLSIGAAYGVLVVVFQWGWLDGFLGFESLGSLDTINVPLLLAVVFGLSMDYEVFLLSRIRERYLIHGDNQRAVAEGLASSARTISSAALIMVAVFSVFVLTGVPSIKMIGLGNAVAIALDATLVRLILVPAAMRLMGDWNWWIPAWLDRLLPRVSFEGGGGRAPQGAEA